MQGLVDYWLGEISREVESGMMVRLVVLVDLMLFFWHNRWTLLVASDFERCFEIKSTVIPGQVVKYTCFMARRKVDVMGLKAVPCRKAAR